MPPTREGFSKTVNRPDPARISMAPMQVLGIQPPTIATRGLRTAFMGSTVGPTVGKAHDPTRRPPSHLNQRLPGGKHPASYPSSAEMPGGRHWVRRSRA